MFGIDDAAAAIAGSAIGGGLDFFGANSANEVNRRIARDANEANRDMAREQMSFQERMSNTSYQRAVADMRKAGINPMLLVSRGAGASTPGGAAIGAQTGAPQQNEFSGVPQSVFSAVALSRLKADIDKVKSDTSLNQQLADTSRSQEALNNFSAKSVAANTAITLANAPKAKLHGEFYDSILGLVNRGLSQIKKSSPTVNLSHSSAKDVDVGDWVTHGGVAKAAWPYLKKFGKWMVN